MTELGLAVEERRACPLCGKVADDPPFHEDRRRAYHRCGGCGLVFTPPSTHPSPEEERARYALHQNDEDDEGYRQFLMRLAGPLLERLEQPGEGLDFGCGPSPLLARLLEAGGHRVLRYDPFFAPDPSPLLRDYDFVAASEVVEHMHRPGPELGRLWQRVRPGGWLGIMTEAPPAEGFDRWHYKNDPTHVVFFGPEALEWLARRWGTAREPVGATVSLFQKPATAL